MTSVFNIHPNDLTKKLYYIKPINGINLTFLNIIKDKYNINVDIYYNIIKSNDEFKLKNIFYFMNLRLKNVNMKIEYEKVTYDNIDDIFLNFINNDIVNCIIIMNMLQYYIYP